MNKTELNKLLAAGEWNDAEFKEAKDNVPKSAYETVVINICCNIMCEQAGTGLRMMRETWRKLGHPSPTYDNDRIRKSFEFFIPGLDKEVDMASDLMKAMFGVKSPTQSNDSFEVQEAQVEAQEAQEAQVELANWQLSILTVCATGEQTGKRLLEVAGYKTRTGNFKKGLQQLVEQQLIAYTLPGRPNSPLQKYRLTEKGRQTLAHDLMRESRGGNQ